METPNGGSVEQFRQNWQREETKYCHWTRGEPVNQIQFAFRQNWLEFAKIMEPLKPWDNKRALEVGAGRGTMSMYFADAGFQCTLLDACEEPLNQAKQAFQENGLSARYVLGDALEIPLADESFDVVFSYGLLEHFEFMEHPLKEQVRVLRRGGALISYIVPHEPNHFFDWARCLCAMLGSGPPKEPVYRGEHDECDTIKAHRYAGLENVRLEAAYPIAMISGSSEFPFTLNSPEFELNMVRYMEAETKRYGWLASGRGSQGLIVWGWKK